MLSKLSRVAMLSCFISGLRAEISEHLCQFFNMISQFLTIRILVPFKPPQRNKSLKIGFMWILFRKMFCLWGYCLKWCTQIHTFTHTNRCCVLIRPLHRALGLSCKLTCTCYVETNYTVYDKLHLVMVVPLLDLSVNVPCIYDRFQVNWIVHCPHLYLASVFCFSLKTGRD